MRYQVIVIARPPGRPWHSTDDQAIDRTVLVDAMHPREAQRQVRQQVETEGLQVRGRRVKIPLKHIKEVI